MIEPAGAQPRDDDRVAELLLARVPEGPPLSLTGRCLRGLLLLWRQNQQCGFVRRQFHGGVREQIADRAQEPILQPPRLSGRRLELRGHPVAGRQGCVLVDPGVALGTTFGSV